MHMVIPVPAWAWQCRSPPNRVEIVWRCHQTTKCGTTHKVKLAKGNFITEYLVPTPVHSEIEAKYAMTSTMEFSSVFLVSNSLTTWTLIKLQTATCSIALLQSISMILAKPASGHCVPSSITVRLTFSSLSRLTMKTRCSMLVHSSVMLDIHDICKTTQSI